MRSEMQQIGLLMHNWHSSMGDPIYAVGSYFFSGQKYPDKSVVEAAKSSLECDREKPCFRGKAEQTELRKIVRYLDRYLRDNP